METLSFAFGMLTTFAVILVIAVIVGIVKVYKQGNKINTLSRWVDENQNGIHARVSSETDYIRRQIDEDKQQTSREFEKIYNEINHVLRDSNTHTNSYVDMRIDKLEAKLTGKTEKQLLKN
jgi:predicted Holliday junction resolvase-like endonuclease